MDKSIIAIAIEKEQEVYCPMCECWHENSGWCQLPMGEWPMPGVRL